MTFKKNAKKKYILSATCTLLAVVTAGVAVMSTTQTALARATLPGVEKIIQDNGTDNPFVILEIVPEKEDAALGFLVDGEEPVDDTAKSIKDMPSFEERSARMGNVAVNEALANEKAAAISEKINNLGIGNAVDYTAYTETDNATGENIKSIDIRGVFNETDSVPPSGDYALREATEQYNTITVVDENTENPSPGEYKPSQLIDIELYRRHIAFRPTGEGIDGTNYAVKLEPLGDTTDLPVKFVRGVNAEVDEDSPVIEAYNHQYFVIKEITKEVIDEGTGEVKNVVDTEAMEKYLGEMVFKVNIGDDCEIESLSYAGVLTNAQQAMLMFARPPVREDGADDKTVSENEIETETETETESTTESTTETETSSESTTETTTEPTTPPETTGTPDTSTPPDTTGTTETPPSTTESGKEDEENEDGNKGKETEVEPSGEEFYADNQVMAFTTKKMARMSIKLDVLVENIGNDIQYVVVKEADGSDSDADVFYYISSVAEDSNADLMAMESYNRFIVPDTEEERTALVGETFYVRKDNTLPYEYKPGNDGMYTFTADYTQEIYDTVSYKGGFTNEEWFKKYVFDLDDSQLADMCIDVVTVTLDELNEKPELLAKADLIYFGDITGDGFPELSPQQGQTNDNEKITFTFDNGYSDTSGNHTITPKLNNGSGYHGLPDDKYFGMSGGGYAEVNLGAFLQNAKELTISFVDPVCVPSTVDISDILSKTSYVKLGRGNWENGEYYNGMLDEFSIANYAVDETDNLYNSIIEKVTEGVPVVLNRSLLDGNNKSLAKMAALLMQKNIENPNISIDDYDLNALKNSMIQPLSDGTQTFVNENVFVYDDVSMGNVVSDKFANGSFYNSGQIEYGFADVVDEIENENFYLEVAGKEDRISDEITMATAIRHIINHEDKRVVTKTSLRVLDLEPYDFEDYYPESAYAQEEPWREDYRHKTVYEDIKSADADRDSAKIIETDSICITDGKLDKNRWIIDNIASQFEGDTAGLDVTIMGTKEFIGKLDDLNAEYDLIYLGLDTSIMNTKMEGSGDTRTKTDETVYNDSSMNGLVYTHVGDSYPIDSTRNSISGNYRLSGNDITYDKLRELREYIEAGYAVIISDGFLKKEGNVLKVNTDKIDKSSNMYELINGTVLKTDDNGAYRYYGKNVNSKGNLEDGAANVYTTRETFNRYLNISKLTLKYSDADLPTAYNQSDGQPHYLSADSDGIYRLYFNIELENEAAVGLSTTTYDCKLYVDVDADGRYEDVEMLTGLSITDSSGNGWQADGNGHFRLKAGEKYRISREIPEGYTGFLAWKLVFEMNDRTYSGTDDQAVVRSNIIGYSAVPVSGIKPTINILQITTYPETAGEIRTNLDLNDEHMHTLYANVQDFDIQVKQIPASEYVSMSDTYFNGCTTYAEYLKQFDMLVMGFTDMYKYGNGIGTDHIGNAQGPAVTEADVINSMLAVREYALSGRSMMFTHDLNSMHVDPGVDLYWRNWGWYANQILRDIQGMDRFGVLGSSALIPGDAKYQYESQYDKAYLDGEKVDNAGLANSLILDWNHKARLAGQSNWDYKLTFDDARSIYTYGENARLASWNYSTHLNYQTNSVDHYHSSYVSKVNAGQITEYPYDIADTFAATHSHPQYLQLNMDTNSRDANADDDIVVWYALDKIPGWCDSIYAANEMDVRNNFFIYNKGNITYTGSGDSMIEPNDPDKIMERKLFVNTLVASYRSGTHAARALFKESEWETSATITSTYLPYDPAMNDGNGGFLNQELILNFKTTNMDLRKSDEPIKVKFYVEGSSTVYDLAVDGNYYKEIAPESIDRLVVQDGGIIKDPEQTKVIANNSMHQVKFKHEKLGLMDGNTIRAKNSTTIYIRLGYEEMVNGNISLPATESITGLNIVCTQLFELK